MRGICGKVCHRARNDAERSLAVGRSRTDVIQPDTLHVYFCLDCYAWHIGHDGLPAYNKRRTK